MSEITTPFRVMHSDRKGYIFVRRDGPHIRTVQVSDERYNELMQPLLETLYGKTN